MFRPISGDTTCLPNCIAYLMNRDAATIPLSCYTYGNWYGHLVHWLAQRKTYIRHYSGIHDVKDTQLVVVLGVSPRLVRHAVVYRGWKLHYDPTPHPDKGVLNMYSIFSLVGDGNEE